MISDRLDALRKAMKAEDVQALIIPTSDFHDTEYVSAHFKAREYFSGFTGSAGTLVVLEEGGALWTDGRYFIQAARQLKDSGITLMKEGQPGTPTILEYIIANLKPGQTVGVDGRTISYKEYEEDKETLAKHDIKIKVDEDIPGLAWPDRPDLPASKTYNYPINYAGEEVSSKLNRVREKMEEAGAKHHVTTKLDEIAWLFNLRADDIPDFPVALAYALVDEDGGVLYIDQARLDPESRQLLEDNQIDIKNYDDIYDDVKELEGPVLLQADFVNSKIGTTVKEPVWGKNPVTPMKAIKNLTEQDGFRKAHIKDGAAMVRFWKWLEESMKAGKTITEQDAVRKVHELRAKQPGFIEDSFGAISAYGSNAAMPHYSSSDDNPVVIEPKGLYLLDSGGQYIDGTTDITRTFVMGDLTEEERESFTKVLQGHIGLASAKFPEGTRGYNLDILARQPLWDEYMDYNHGTGHGVGAMLSVHEGPNSFHWKVTPTRNGSTILEEGMVTSDEPGLYMEGEYGIRHENLLLTKKLLKNDYHQFMGHEVLTMVPFDVRGLDLDLMTRKEKDWLNNYHKEVYEKVSPLLDPEEALWLKEKTKPIE